jgi:hypothetical protein
MAKLSKTFALSQLLFSSIFAGNASDDAAGSDLPPSSSRVGATECLNTFSLYAPFYGDTFTV